MKVASHKYFRLGHLGGHVILDSNSAQFIGARAANSFTAEVSAINWGLALTLDLPGSVPITFHHDNISAGKVAAAEWDSASNALLSTTVAVANIVASSRRFISYEHVKGHSGHP